MSHFDNMKMLIGGHWRLGAAHHATILRNPATEGELGEVPFASDVDVDDALDAADHGFKTWSRTSALERQGVMDRAASLMSDRRDSIANVLTQEMGKPLVESRMEVEFAISATRWYGEEGRRAYGRLIPPRARNMRHIVVKEPVGPVIAFSAWNFPATNVIRKVSGALAAGCSIIIKPSNETPATCLELARCFQDAGLPSGVLNVIFGEPDMVSQRLMASSIPKKVTLTGSTPVGKHLTRLAADTLKRCTMELGGHAPVIIADDCDLEATLSATVAAKFRNAGQVCTSPTRFLVQEDVYTRFVNGFSERAAALRVGNGLANETQMGPMFNKRRIAWINELIIDAQEKGAKVSSGGSQIGSKGSFYAPTVLSDVPNTCRAMNEEPFAPLALISPFRKLDDAIEEANRLTFGLAAYGFTRSQASALRIQSELHAGVIGVNQCVVSIPEAPFGGVNETGWGSEGGIEGLETFLRTKFVNELAI